MQVEGRALLADNGMGIHPCFWRAPTDNDRGGVKGHSYAARWAAAGLQRLGVAPGTLSISADHGSRINCRTVDITASWQMVPLASTSGEAVNQLSESVGVGEVGGAHWLSLKEESRPEDQRLEDAAGMGLVPCCRAQLSCQHPIFCKLATCWTLMAFSAGHDCSRSHGYITHILQPYPPMLQ